MCGVENFPALADCSREGVQGVEVVIL